MLTHAGSVCKCGGNVWPDHDLGENVCFQCGRPGGGPYRLPDHIADANDARIRVELEGASRYDLPAGRTPITMLKPYLALRAQGMTIAAAAAQTPISVRQANRYEARMRGPLTKYDRR